MNILLNELLTLSADANGGNFIIQGVTGLGTSDIRTSSFLFSGRSGGLVTDQFFGFRTIVINGRIGSNTSTQQSHKEDREAMQAACPIGETIPIYITVFSGETYRIDANVTDLKMEYRQRGYMSDYLLQLTAGDPYFYTTDGGDEQSANVDHTVEGGYITPYILPVIWAEGGQPVVVLNSGVATVYPVITLSNGATNPVITNQTTGESFALDMTVLDGEVVVIDMRQRTVTLNGVSIMGNKTDDSIWWGLVPGNNSILLDSDSGSDPMTGVITWRNGLLSI